MEYETIAAPVETELEISRSRFLTHLERVDDEVEAREVIASVKAEHPKARHHCTAFVIGPKAAIQRSNDDGEPAGTAGAPMLEALTAAGLSDVVAIVTRYFGGVLLGAGGLTRAYRSAVAEATAAAKRVARAKRQTLTVTSAYDIAPQIEAWARRSGIAITGTDYQADVTLDLAVDPDDAKQTVCTIAELSAGSALITPGETAYVDLIPRYDGTGTRG